MLDGASNPEDLAIHAKEIGLSALALTDHDDLGGAVRFAFTAKELCLDAIIGAELTLDDDSHITLLASDETGYKNLCSLITSARFNSDRGSPRVRTVDLYESNGGLIALSGCPHGRIPTSFAKGNIPDAQKATLDLKEVFQDRFYLEIWNHYILQEQVIARQLIELSNSIKIPWVVTNNVHYATTDRRIVHDVLTCLRHEVTLSEAGRRLRPNGSWYMKSPDEMAYMWRHDLRGIHRTL
ncbi:MAG: PHP domain-containing protein, partial [Cyanobacteria bacterium]|nr:PHP domain-containing protein [Cyanobacteriota bacterium]